VDTHIHLAAAMNQKRLRPRGEDVPGRVREAARARRRRHLLRFIKKKCRVAPHEVVTHSADGKPVTLQNVFEQMGTTPHDLNLDALGMHADTSTFCRFDKFNLKYNPLGARERAAMQPRSSRGRPQAHAPPPRHPPSPRRRRRLSFVA